MVIHQLVWRVSLSSVIYQLSVIGADASNIGSWNLEHNLTNTFVCANSPLYTEALHLAPSYDTSVVVSPTMK